MSEHSSDCRRYDNAVAINAPFTPLQETTRAAPAKAREFARLGFGD